MKYHLNLPSKNMNFTFGIITYNDGARTQLAVRSILREDIPDCQIIVVGGENFYNDERITHIPFDESIKKAWITKKKNIITENARHDNIVYMHDYFKLDKGWYQKFVQFEDDWDICMNRINAFKYQHPWGYRFRDWAAWDDPSVCNIGGMHSCVIMPYSYNVTKHMYISGGYWVAKKKVMEEEPLNETLCWGEGEDVEWSKRVRVKYKYLMNPHSAVRLTKSKNAGVSFIDENRIYWHVKGGTQVTAIGTVDGI